MLTCSKTHSLQSHVIMHHFVCTPLKPRLSSPPYPPLSHSVTLMQRTLKALQEEKEEHAKRAELVDSMMQRGLSYSVEVLHSSFLYNAGLHCVCIS